MLIGGNDLRTPNRYRGAPTVDWTTKLGAPWLGADYRLLAIEMAKRTFVVA
jgi:hypothetical protein